MKKKTFVILISVLCAICLVIGGYILKITVFSAKETEEKYTKLKVSTPILHSQPTKSEETTEEPVPVDRIKAPNLLNIQEKYPAVVAWLQIPDTQVDYPVAQPPKDNPEYYLRRDLDGNYFNGGCLFLDASCEAGRDINVIYGHNMMNGTMFRFLTKYMDAQEVNKHPVIYYDTASETADYVVFGVFKTSVDIRLDDYFPYVTYYFNTPEERVQYLYDVRVRSIVNTHVPVNENDELLVLSTCEYDFDDCRLVIVARKVRDGETVDTEFVGAEENRAPLQSSAYYAVKGGKAPDIPALFENIQVDALPWYDGGLRGKDGRNGE